MNKKTIVFIQEGQSLLSKVLKASFDKTEIRILPSNYTPFDREKLAKEINNNYQQVIFYGYEYQFYVLLPLISKKVVKKFIIDKSLPLLVKPYFLSSLSQIFEYKERGLIDYIATTQYDLYITFKEKMKFIQFDYKGQNMAKKSNSIGILNYYYLEESDFYNELSGIALSKIPSARVLDQNIITKKFGEDFNVEIIEEKDIEKLIYENTANLNCMFCDINNILFLMSMDAGIPCILGNTNLLDDNKKLKEYLVLKSDDDVNEISEKINHSIDKKEEILKLYKEWRLEYSKKAKKSIDDFLKLGG